MSTIAWDGKTLAADRGMFDNHRRVPGGATKMKVVNSCNVSAVVRPAMYWALKDAGYQLTGKEYDGPAAMAGCGTYEGTLELFDWFENGCLKDEWPASQHSDNWTNFIVAGRDWCIEFGKEPVPMVVRSFLSWGAGAEMALGVLAATASAVRAIEVCNEYHVYSGPGISFVDTSYSEWQLREVS